MRHGKAQLRWGVSHELLELLLELVHRQPDDTNAGRGEFRHRLPPAMVARPPCNGGGGTAKKAARTGAERRRSAGRIRFLIWEVDGFLRNVSETAGMLHRNASGLTLGAGPGPRWGKSWFP